MTIMLPSLLVLAIGSAAGQDIMQAAPNEHYAWVAKNVPPVPAQDIETVRTMVDSGARGVKKADSGIWVVDELLPPRLVQYVLSQLPPSESPKWTGCPRIEHNPLKRCFHMPIGSDSLLRQVVSEFKKVWGSQLDTSEISHLAINRVLPGKVKDDLHADIFAERQTLERPTAHNIIYLTDPVPRKEETQTEPLSVSFAGGPETKQWPARPDADGKSGINIIYLTDQPSNVPANESGQLIFPHADVKVTPKAGSMVSFAMTDDNDHFVGTMAAGAADRISIQFPVSVFGPSSAKTYAEFVGNGPAPTPSPVHEPEL